MTADQFRKALLEQFGIKDLRIHTDKNGLLSFQGTYRQNSGKHVGDDVMMTYIPPSSQEESGS